MDPKLTHDADFPSDDLTTITYLAKPSGVCCLSSHTIHSGSPNGSFIPIDALETYISKPAEGEANGHVLIYFPDVWGMHPNSLLIMDYFASCGYTVLCPDYFRGDPIWKHRKNSHDMESEPDFDYEAWKAEHVAFANSAVPTWVAAVKRQFYQPGTRFACVGYCLGAPYVCDLLARGDCEAGAFAHPAYLKEHHFAKLGRPLYLACAECDHTFDTESRRKAVDIMSQAGKRYCLQVYSGVEHGFALRGDMDDHYERWVKENCLKGFVEWFDFWLAL